MLFIIRHSLFRHAILLYMNPAPGKGTTPIPFPLYRSGAHPCPYLPGRDAAEEMTLADWMDGAAYQHLMNLGFRRSGRLVYRPVCEDCRECIPLRIPVERFRPSRSQRRVWRRNRDVTVEVGLPEPTDEKWRLYVAYLRFQHDGTMSEGREDFLRFLYDSPIETIEMVYRVGRRVVGVGIVDACPSCLSSVYFYFDPAEAHRSLGVYSILSEIAACRQRALPYWYGGFYVRDCSRMSYKADFHPNELLGAEGLWRANEA